MSRQYVIIPDSGQAEMLTTHSTPVTVSASDINPVIEQRVLRSGQPYLSPAHILDYQSGPYGVPYWMQGLALQTCDVWSISAPQNQSMLFNEFDSLSTQGQYAFGQAPTTGIYTGYQEEVC